MSVEVVRRVRLPADRRTPAAARAVVRSVLAEARLTDLLDEALLLTTELSTNGVLHAGTDLDLEVATDSSGVTVTVLDQAPGRIDRPVPGPRESPGLAERGRGLLLVDYFASRWGTTHHPKGKAVWFRLELPATASPGETPAGDGSAGAGAAGAGAAGDGSTGAGAAGDGSAGAGAAGARLGGADPDAFGTEAVAALLAISPEPLAEDSTARFADELLRCVAQRLGATGATVRLDRADGAGMRTIARYGLPPDRSALRLPLPVGRLWSGDLQIAASATPLYRPLAALAADRIGLVAENERLRVADMRRQIWLTFLAEASELLAQSLDVELTLALIPRLVVPRLGRWCAVHLTDEWGDLNLAAVAHADESAVAPLVDLLGAPAPEGVLDRLRDAAQGSASMPLNGPTEGFAVPLMARGQRLGTLAVGRHVDHRQDPDEMAVLEDVARRAALALDNARIHAERRRIAHMLQQSLLPPTLPTIAGVELSAEYVPSGDEIEVGGDFYDVLPMPDGRWLVVIGDVSGKGVQAASVTGHVREVIRVLVADGRSLPSVLSTLNSTLAERGGGRYCTLALAAVARSLDGRLDVSLHLAGHDRPVLVGSDGRTSFVGTGGTALGLLESVTSPVSSVWLGPGDTLVFYTDGVTERRRRGELFGTGRLRAAAAPLAGYAADVVAARLRSATLNFSPEPPRDDIAILVMHNELTTAGG